LNELSFSKAAGKSLLTLVKHYIARSGTVLDYGCGDGYLLKLLCDLGFKSYGYEPSEIRRNNLRKVLDIAPNFGGFIDDHDGKKFQCVICAEVIEHILDEDFDNFVNILSSRVDDGGYLIITTPNNEDLDLNMAYCPVSDAFFHRWQHVRSFDASNIENLFQKKGFEKVVTHQVELSKGYFENYDEDWTPDIKIKPDYFEAFKSSRPINVGNQSNLVFICRKPYSMCQKIKNFIF
jgi:SAM-dependent methyltransferase